MKAEAIEVYKTGALSWQWEITGHMEPGPGMSKGLPVCLDAGYALTEAGAFRAARRALRKRQRCDGWAEDRRIQDLR